MADTAVFTLRLPSDLEAMIDICPGDTRTARIIGIIKFAFEQGYPGTELVSSSPLEDRLANLEAQYLKDKERYDHALERHYNDIEAIKLKLNKRSFA